MVWKPLPAGPYVVSIAAILWLSTTIFFSVLSAISRMPQKRTRPKTNADIYTIRYIDDNGAVKDIGAFPAIPSAIMYAYTHIETLPKSLGRIVLASVAK